MENDTKTSQPLQVVTGDELSRGRYSNSLFISNSPEEFVFDWLLNSVSGSHLVARIIVSPGHLKRIVAAATDSLKKYEKQFGEIKVVEAKDQRFQ
jgi:hypothetical protein